MATRKKKAEVVQPEQLDLFGYDVKSMVDKILKETDNEVCRELFESEVSLERGYYDSTEVTEFKEKLQKEGIVITHIERYGGEDQGREYWSVYSFSKGDDIVYVKFDGWYASYNGSEYEEWYFAKAVPKKGFDFTKE